jgi:hypothetical protein
MSKLCVNATLIFLKCDAQAAAERNRTWISRTQSMFGSVGSVRCKVSILSTHERNCFASEIP